MNWAIEILLAIVRPELDGIDQNNVYFQQDIEIIDLVIQHFVASFF